MGKRNWQLPNLQSTRATRTNLSQSPCHMDESTGATRLTAIYGPVAHYYNAMQIRLVFTHDTSKLYCIARVERFALLSCRSYRKQNWSDLP